MTKLEYLKYLEETADQITMYKLKVNTIHPDRKISLKKGQNITVNLAKKIGLDKCEPVNVHMVSPAFTHMMIRNLKRELDIDNDVEFKKRVPGVAEESHFYADDKEKHDKLFEKRVNDKKKMLDNEESKNILEKVDSNDNEIKDPKFVGTPLQVFDVDGKEPIGTVDSVTGEVVASEDVELIEKVKKAKKASKKKTSKKRSSKKSSDDKKESKKAEDKNQEDKK